MSSFAFVGSQKKWAGSKQVNMEVDDGREIFRKQLVASEEAGHYEKMQKRTNRTNAQMRVYKESEKQRMLATPPVKVDDSPSFGLEDAGR